MIHPEDLRQLVIRPTLEFIGLWSQAAENLLLGTWCHESTIGNYTRLKQVKGPALGGYQMEPASHQDNWNNFLRYPKQNGLRDCVLSLVSPSGFDQAGKVLDSELITNLRYATAQARIKYYRVPAALPSAGNLPALGEYWKTYYNSPQGAGTAQDFIRHYPQ